MICPSCNKVSFNVVGYGEASQNVTLDENNEPVSYGNLYITDADYTYECSNCGEDVTNLIGA